MNWKNLRVAVTGAGGFIGSHMSEELARKGAKVRALVRYNSLGKRGFLEDAPRDIDVWAGDVADPWFVQKFVQGQEVVFHLAALIGIPYSYEAPAQYVSVNVNGTLNVLESCLRAKVKKVVHTSTSETYGTALYTPIDEKHPLQGQSPYSATKIGADALADSFFRSFGLPVAVARPFNTYGPRQSARAVIPTIISQLLAGKPALSLGDVTPVRDFNYVADTVAGFLAVAESSKTPGQVINLGSGRGVTVGETAALIMRLLGRKVPVQTQKARVRPSRSEVFKLLCDNSKARKLVGWRPRYTLEQGLALTINYIQGNSGLYRPDVYSV
jgi:NAD dependent epimerase/dehydratase